MLLSNVLQRRLDSTALALGLGANPPTCAVFTVRLTVFFLVAVFSRNMKDTQKKKRPLIAARERGGLWEVQVGFSHGE